MSKPSTVRYAIVLAAALVVIPTLGEAKTRVETGTGRDDYGRASACADAKKDVRRYVDHNERVTSYSACDCSQNKFDTWTCTVNATVREDD